MDLRRSLLRTFCMWFTCALVGVIAAPSLSTRSVATTEIVYDQSERARPSASVQCAPCALLATSSAPARAQFEPRRARSPRPHLASARFVVSERYLRHCALLL